MLKNKPIKVSNLIERFKSKLESDSVGHAIDYLKVDKVIFAYCVVFNYDVSKMNVVH